MPWSLPSRITTKVLKNCKTFSSRPRPNVQDQDQDFHFCPPDQDQAGLEDNITGNRCKEARCISYSIASHISAVLLSELSKAITHIWRLCILGHHGATEIGFIIIIPNCLKLSIFFPLKSFLHCALSLTVRTR